MVNDITMENMQPGGMEEDDNMHIVMFFGTTCGPCKATMPHYEAASDFFEERNAKIRFHRINAWEPQDQAKYVKEIWQVEGVPNFKAFFHGEVVHERRGGGDTDAMKKFISEAIGEAFKRFNVRL
jgi:thiol-disulfide isomerase/thioredoxin